MKFNDAIIFKWIVSFLFISLAACKTKTSIQNDEVKIHALRLKSGQDLKKEIETYVLQHNIKAGWVMTCVGSVTLYHLRFTNQPQGTKDNGHFEIVSVTGTVSVSDSTGKTIGGHLLDSNFIYTTAEIVIG